ncbi:MAG: nuclear transport factor 2 family protein [Ignavibacteria bacterium]|nr:nuclear transport factor 2 family protein [Ignavibacteria bacterium]
MLFHPIRRISNKSTLPYSFRMLLCILYIIPNKYRRTFMEKALADLIAKDEIIQVINLMVINTDKRNWNKVRECFAPSVLFDMTGEAQRVSPGQITDGWETGLKELKAIHHQMGNFLIDLNGDQADVFCYGIAYHYLPNPSEKNTRVFVGSYDFHLLKLQDGWKIDSFKFNLKFIDGNKELEKSRL